MANEFIARNGITSLGNIVVSGSITTTGTVAISGSIASASFAATASSADNLLVRNTLTAQTLVVQTITSSVDFVTGSTRFGSIAANTHVFTGSVLLSGSMGIGTNPIHNFTLAGGQTTPGSFSGGNYYFGIYSGSVSTVLRETFAIGSDNSYVYMQSFSSKPLYINSAGNNIILGSAAGANSVGIGTTDITERFTVNVGVGARAGMALTGEYPYLRFNVTSSNANARNWILTPTWAEPGDMILAQSTIKDGNPLTQGANDIMYFSRGGNIGIGNSSPNGKLHIQQSVEGEVITRITNTQGASGNTNAKCAIKFTLQNGTNGSSGEVVLLAGKESDHQGANVNDYFAISTTANDAVGERMRISAAGVTTLKGPTMTVGSQGTYALAVGESGYPNITIGYKQATAGYIQTWSSTALYLNQQGNAAYAGAVRLDTLSDERIKDNIQPITGCLNKVLQLNGKKFHLKDEPENKIRYGFIAQEVQSHLSDFVIESTREYKDENIHIENLLTLENSGTAWAALLVEAIKELSAKVTALEAK